VDEIGAVLLERCRYCQQPFPETAARRRGRVWPHQVAELLPLAVRMTEYQMAVPCCPGRGRRTRAVLPAGVPRRPFGARLAAVVALLSGRHRLSRREVRLLLQDPWAVRESLGAVVRQEQAPTANPLEMQAGAKRPVGPKQIDSAIDVARSVSRVQLGS
jgi:transposase